MTTNYTKEVLKEENIINPEIVKSFGYLSEQVMIAYDEGLIGPQSLITITKDLLSRTNLCKPRELELLDDLSIELALKAVSIKLAMTEMTGGVPERIKIISLPSQYGDQKLLVLLATPSGRVADTQEEIMSADNDEDYVIEIGNVRFDTRSGMTAEAYEAFIKNAIETGEHPLPDSNEIVETGYDQHIPCTYLTGDYKPGYALRVGMVQNGEALTGYVAGKGPRDYVYVRPAVIVSKMLPKPLKSASI